MMRFLSPEAAIKMIELASKSYRPSQIIELSAQIEGEFRAVELSMSLINVINPLRIQKIIEMKLELDRLYVAWAEGKIE